MKYIFTCILITLIMLVSGAARNTDSVNPYYEDRDNDGVNDLYIDADGDGINDYNSEERMHNVDFIDADSNGINDIFTDCDGDGVNDIYYMTGQCPVVDVNEDGFNDITGYCYSKGDYGGYRYGFIIDECGRIIDEYTDKDNDFMDDNYMKMSRKQMHDKFIDEDEDGMSDSRKHMYRKGKNRHKNED